MRKVFISTFACIALMACGSAFAQGGKIQSGPYKGPMVPMAASDAPDAVFYSNMQVDPCTSCSYDTNNGYLVLGPNNCGIPGSTQWLAYPFISNATGTTRQVTLGMTNWSVCTPTSNKVTVQIYSDNCSNAPGTALGTPAVATVPPSACSTARARISVPLTAGQKYWVVVTTSAAATQNATTAVWWETNTAWSDYNLNDGNGWQAFPPGSPGAFSVQ
jgi:hypothetical protein